MSREGQVEVARDYTKARKFPQLIGRTPDGMRIPGGPYTIVEAVGVGLTLFVGYETMWLWARFGFFGNLLVLGSVTLGVWFVLHRIPLGSRPPTSVATGALNSVTRPRNGAVAGKAIRLPRPKAARNSLVYANELPVEHRAVSTAETVPQVAAENVARRATGRRQRRADQRKPARVGLDVLTPKAITPTLAAVRHQPAVAAQGAPMSTVQRLLAGQGANNV